MNTSYDIEVRPKSGWVPSNRTQFPTWIDKTFKYKDTTKKAAKAIEKCEEGQPCPQLDTVTLFPHQNFIKDYIQFDSPYRGILLLHGLGTGKTATSIAAAEMLLNHMDVVVMLPASLRNNFINEIKKYGRNFYKLKQRWTFLTHKQIHDDLDEISRILSLPKQFIVKQDGLWIPNYEKGAPNYSSLSQVEQQEINNQINTIIEGKFNFINYNGLKTDHIRKMIADGKNPFDNKCIIVDEVHNLISRIVGGKRIGSALYKLLMSAKGVKLILLSGTPIINYPYEVAYLINLLTGPREMMEISLGKQKVSDDAIKAAMVGKYVDAATYDRNARKITVSFLPLGFEMKDRVKDLIVRGDSKAGPEELLVDFVKTLGLPNEPKTRKRTIMTLPEKEDDFNQYFVSMEKEAVINHNLFMRRILGTVSYYSTYSEALYPSVSMEEIKVPLNDYQFSTYVKSRAEERKKESSMKFKKGNKSAGNLFSNSGQVYRFYSRANCNFVFPEKIKRPFPSTLKALKKFDEIDEIDDAISQIDIDDEPAAPTDYVTLLKDALNQVYQGEFLLKDNLAQYSPKFKVILDNIEKSPGKLLVYSQFRTVEGLGLLAMTLKKQGFVEMRLKKNKKEWDLDVDANDMAKPKYMIFTGSNEETDILLNIYNNQYDNLPKLIKERLKGTSNLYGEVIKVAMITQSGAEGISLKHVRQVHIIEPYWNYIRVDQVVGRAVRTNSHVELPPTDRNVKVFVYYSVFTKKQLDNDFTIKTLDKGKTSDEHIFEIAKKKKAIIDSILDLLKKSSVDCALNGKTHIGLRCFSFPVNYKKDALIQDISQEVSPVAKEQKFEAEVYITKKGNFIVNKITNEVYDYDIYMNSKKLVKLGILTKKTANEGL